MTGLIIEKSDLPQVVSSANTKVITSADASPGSPWVGAWEPTRRVGVVRELTVLAATDQTVGGLGGTFTFEFGEDGTSALISEVRTIGDFVTVRDFDLLNAGSYYRVKFEPDRALGSDAVFVTTTLRRVYDGAFVRLADQQIERSNAAMPQTFAYLKGFTADGISKNVGVLPRAVGDYSLAVDAGLDLTMFGSLNVESMTAFISIAFDSVATMEVDTVSLATSTGSETVTSNNLVISTGAGTTARAGRRSKDRLIYEPGHEARAQFTAVFDASTTGAVQRIGIMDETQDNGAWFEDDGTGFYIVHQRGGVVASKVAIADWNGNMATTYTVDGVVEQLDPANAGHVYRIRFGYLGYAGIIYQVRSHDGFWVTCHVIRYDSETVPLFSSLALYLGADITKASGSGDVVLKSASWQAGVFASPTGHSTVSAANSTMTALGSAGVFTGDWDDIGTSKSLVVSIVTDQVSATDGIAIQYSDLGDSSAVVRDFRHETFSASDVAAGKKEIIVPPHLAFFRIIYTNGGTAQGSFFMQARLHISPVELARGGIKSDVSAANTALMTRGALVAENDSNQWSNITRASSGGLRVAVNQHEAETPIKSLSSGKVSRATVTTTAAKVIATPLTNRRSVSLKAITSAGKIIYVAFNSANATTASGFPLNNQESIDLELDDTVDIWASCDSGTQALSVVEVGTS